MTDSIDLTLPDAYQSASRPFQLPASLTGSDQLGFLACPTFVPANYEQIVVMNRFLLQEKVFAVRNILFSETEK